MPLLPLYLAWRDESDARSRAGELRPTPAETEALARFVEALAAADEEERARWEETRAALDGASERLCSCGHPLAHHDASGSCFHVVGCATGCDCRQ
jgi:hypothetical protein